MQFIQSSPQVTIRGKNESFVVRTKWLRNIYLLVIALAINSSLMYVFRDRLRITIPIDFLYLNIGLIAVQVAGLLLLWRNRVVVSTYVTVYGSVLLLFLLIPYVTGTGISVELASIFIVVVSISNTILTGRWSFLLWVMCLAVAVVLFWFDYNNIPLGEARSSPETAFITFMACLFFAYFPQRILMRESQRFAKLAQHSADALTKANEELQVKTAELEKSHEELELRIMERTMALTHEVEERTEVASALQESEQRFRALVEGTFEGFVILDDGYVVMANGVWAKLMHLDSAEILGLSFYDIFDRETAEQAMMRISIDDDIPSEVQGKLKDGTEVAFELISNEIILQNKSAQIVGFRDITERIRTELKLREAQKLDSLGVLAGGVAHDFNNLLVAMLAQNSLALSILPEDHKAHRHVGKAVKAAEQAAALTKQLLAYTGRGHFDVRSLQINDVIRDNESLLEAAIAKNVQLRLLFDPRVPTIKADATQLQQILMNLVINGAEAVGSEQGEVTISTTMQHVSVADSDQWQHRQTPIEPGEYVVIEVEDTGDGISEKDLARIFDPFFSTKPHGRGLGLAATIGIMRGHRAGLEVASKEGSGTIFRLLFPMEDQSYALRFTGAEPLSADIVTVHALLIESNYYHLQRLQGELAEANIELVSADTLHDGLSCYRQRAEEISVVIVDLSEPGLKREMVLNELYLHNPNVQVILTSDNEPAESVVDDLVAARLSKPLSAERLINTIYDLV